MGFVEGEILINWHHDERREERREELREELREERRENPCFSRFFTQ
jgi:hypothetical protein